MQTFDFSIVREIEKQTRRDWLKQCGGGCGWLALTGMLSGNQAALAEATRSLGPFAAKPPMMPAKAKNVIWIFMNGGPSQVDTWNYRPELAKRDGQPLEGFDPKTGFFPAEVGAIMKSPFEFKQHGESGTWGSELFPGLAQHVDKMAFIHSCFSSSNNHSPALFMMNTGVTRMGSPCVGSWVTYGLGSECENLPAFIVMSDPLNRGLPKGSASNWGAGFLPSIYQGTWLKPQGEPIDNLKPPGILAGNPQRAHLDLLNQLNQHHARQSAVESELAARIESFEMAYRMQTTAPEALEFSKEPESIHALYGTDKKHCAHFAKQCLLARRFVERGVRFVQIYSGGMENQQSWDGHIDLAGNHSGFAKEADQPIAALLSDLAQSGLLESTLVICAGEFGRLPIAQKGAKPGRDHNPHAFTAWLAGGGIKGGVHYGETDDIGFKAVVDKVGVGDLHATILAALGLDHEKLTFKFQGLDQRLTGVEHHRVIKEIFS